MAYLKPQSPLQHKDGDYFYPLTSVDQVIMEDGSRLNATLNSINPIIETTTSDNGKFLRVVNGAPVWATVLNAEEASF